MRTTLNLEQDALLVAQSLARRHNISLGEAVTRLIRIAAAAPAQACMAEPQGRYALAPRRDEVVTVEHVRDLTAAEGI